MGSLGKATVGTVDWTQHTTTWANLLEAGNYHVTISVPRSDGTAWVDDVLLIRHTYPLWPFMKYPNYRGRLFSDESQVATFSLAVDPPSGTASDYNILRTLKTAAGDTISTEEFASSTATATVDLTGRSAGSYDIFWTLRLESDDSVVYAYPAFRVVVGVTKPTSGWWYDKDNRFMIGSTPAFLIGAYDKALDSNQTTEAGWTAVLRKERRLFDLPLNVYLNYQLGTINATYWSPLFAALQAQGVYGLVTANCQATKPQTGQFYLDTASDSDIQTRTGTAGYMGHYLEDERTTNLVPAAVDRHQKSVRLSSSGVDLANLVISDSVITHAASDLKYWADAADVIGTSAYVLTSSNPTDVAMVARWVAMEKDAVQGSRPVVVMSNLNLATPQPGWPTHWQRDIAWMAVAEGANGILWWELDSYGEMSTAYSLIRSVTAGSPTTFTLSSSTLCTGTIGTTCVKVIAGATGDWAALNGTRTFTRASSTTLTVEIDSTGFTGQFDGTFRNSDLTQYGNREIDQPRARQPPLRFRGTNR